MRNWRSYQQLMNVRDELLSEKKIDIKWMDEDFYLHFSLDRAIFCGFKTFLKIKVALLALNVRSMFGYEESPFIEAVCPPSSLMSRKNVRNKTWKTILEI